LEFSKKENWRIISAIVQLRKFMMQLNKLALLVEKLVAQVVVDS
jgi:hypothetical protein